MEIVLPLDGKQSKKHLLNIFYWALREFALKQEGGKPTYNEYSALIEDWQNLVKIDGSVVEARYFMDLSNPQAKLTKDSRKDSTETKSFLKNGKSSEMVNCGDSIGEWPKMHQALIDNLGLECTESEFNQYMARLCSSIGKEFRNQFCKG